MRKIWNWMVDKAILLLFFTLLLSNYNVYITRKHISFLLELGELDREIIGLQDKIIINCKRQLEPQQDKKEGINHE